MRAGKLKNLERHLGLYFITDNSFAHSYIELAEMALKAGVRVIQFREKRMSTKEMLESAREIRRLTEDYGAIFVVNDRLDIALASDADGVHVGQDDMPPKVVRDIAGDLILGVSVRNVEEALVAERDGADYLGAGPVFTTSTKEDAGDAIGVAGLTEIVKAAKIPVVAIGGINHSNAQSVLETGCTGIAVISAIAANNDPKKSAEKLLEIVRSFKKI
jgi:thiamine-phosphate pyrophosphorylase